MPSASKHSYGRRLMPVVLDELAANNPSRLYAVIAKTTDAADGFRDVTVADMARAVNFMAWWIESHLGRSNSFDTLAFSGVPDLRGVVVWLAAIKCGYKVLLPSPRNPPATNVALMEKTGSKTLLHVVEIAPIVQPLRTLSPSVRYEVIPSFNEMLQSDAQSFPYGKTFEEARDDPILVLHSSGSTGPPKPVTTTHGSFACLDYQKNLPEVPGREKKDWSMWTFEGEARVYSVFPFFHFGGVVTLAVNAIFNNASPVLGPPHRLPDGDLLKQVLLHNKIRALILVPAVAEQLLAEPGGLEFFKGVELLSYGGAPFSQDTGKNLASILRLVPFYAATEFFPVPELHTAREDWDYHEFSPILNYEMRQYGVGDGGDTYEFVLFADESNRDYLALHHNLPGVTEYPTKDLFTRHPDPSKPNLYKFYGRKDDIIVLANGEKFNPVPFETSIQGHPSLRGAFLVGNGRSKAALLIESKSPLEDAEKQQFLQQLWPLVEKSNALVPGQGRILDQSQVLIASPDKPFPRSSKNTVIRRLSENAYMSEIDHLYTASVLQTKVTLEAERVYKMESMVEFVRKILATSFAEAVELGVDDNWFASGFDSIQMIQFSTNMKHNIKEQTAATASWISPRTIYELCTIRSMSQALCEFLNHGRTPMQNIGRNGREVDEAAARYTQLLQGQKAPEHASPSRVSSVAVIGSTGYLGVRLLASLLRNDSVNRIFCLNRSDDAQSRQEKTLLSLDASMLPLLSKLTYMRIIFGKPNLGIKADDYATLVADADVYILNAWRLDFGMTLQSFDPFLDGTCQLVSLAAKSGSRIVFVSSLSSIAALAQSSNKPVPEEPVMDPLAAWSGIGYAQSKLVAERILTHAKEHIGLSVCVVRVGQVGGPIKPVQGSEWAVQRWVSSLIQTSIALGYAPTGVMRLDWLPVEVVAETLQGLAIDGEGFYHLAATTGEPWKVFLEILDELYGIEKSLSLPEWCRLLRDVEPTEDNINRFPALGIQGVFEAVGDGMESVTWSIEKLPLSQMAIPVINKNLIKGWLASWDIKGVRE